MSPIFHVTTSLCHPIFMSSFPMSPFLMSPFLMSPFLMSPFLMSPFLMSPLLMSPAFSFSVSPRLNLTYTNMLSCVNRTSASIWESCSSEAVLGGYSEMIRERFSPWMDTIYDKLMYTKKVIQHADHICNLGKSLSVTC